MQAQVAIETLNCLQGFFGKKLSEEAVKFYCSEFRDVDDDLFRRAVQGVMRVEKTLPTPDTLAKYIRSEQDRPSPGQYRARVRSLADLTKSQPTDPEHVVEAKRLLTRIGRGELAGVGLVEEMALMEKTFPGLGWGGAAASYDSHLRRHHANR